MQLKKKQEKYLRDSNTMFTACVLGSDGLPVTSFVEGIQSRLLCF